MARHTGPVLVDTNAILECFRVSGWRALAGGQLLYPQPGEPLRATSEAPPH